MLRYAFFSIYAGMHILSIVVCRNNKNSLQADEVWRSRLPFSLIVLRFNVLHILSVGNLC